MRIVRSEVTEKAEKEIDSEVRTRYDNFGCEVKIRHFRDMDAAAEWIKRVYTYNVNAIAGLIGFFLDRTLNLIGTTGWDIVMLYVV